MTGTKATRGTPVARVDKIAGRVALADQGVASGSTSHAVLLPTRC